MSKRYSSLEKVRYDIHQNNAPIQFVDCELLFDNYKDNKVIRFKLKNNTEEMVQSAIVTLRFFKQGKLVSIRNYWIKPYYELKARPNDLFGLDTEILFPDKEVNEVEIGVTKVYVVLYRDTKSTKSNKSIENKVCIFSDAKYMGKTPLPDEILKDKTYIDHTSKYISPVKKASYSSVGALVILLMFLLGSCMYHDNQYSTAFELFTAGRYAESMLAFMHIYKYKDSWERYWYIRDRYELTGGDQHIALLEDRNPSGFAYDDAQDNVIDILTGWNDLDDISARASHTVGVNHAGSILSHGVLPGEQPQWSNISQVSAGRNHTVGLQRDGRVVATGDNEYGECNVDSWSDIIAISAGLNHTVGLKKDHTAIATQYEGDGYDGQCEVYNWKNIRAVAAGGYFTSGLQQNGKVVTTPVTDMEKIPIKTDDWKNIVAISASETHIVGLKSDGTVVATGDDTNRQCDITGWGNIVNIFAGDGYTLGFTVDKKILVAGEFVSGDENLKRLLRSDH